MSHPPAPGEIAPGLHRFEKVLASGWGVNMHVLAVPDGGLLVYGPTWLGEGTWDALERLGAPRVLVAPNHFHHLSLSRFRERYPDAVAVASRGAMPRLSKKGHDGLLPLDEAASRLPAGARLLECEGVKSGEAWLLVPGEGGPTLVVGDAFFHVTRPVRGLMGVALRVLQTSPGLCIGKTFRWLALSDRAGYCKWARSLLEQERPRRLAFAHGDPLSDPGLPETLAALVQARLG